MLRLADILVAVLVPFLAATALGLLAMVVFLAMQRGIDEARFRRRRSLTARYRDTVDALLRPGTDDGAVERLARAPRRHRAVIATMLLKPLAISTGSLIDRLRHAALAVGLVERWTGQLADRRWFVRAEAARALGLVRERRALSLLIDALDDDHDEVRAAAVEALGMLGTPQAIPQLLSRLPDQSRHQRTRIIEALRAFGDAATPALIEHAAHHPDDAAMIADVLGLVGGPVSTRQLTSWIGQSQPDVRAAAMRALGTIGLDEAGLRVALRALEDPDPPVRAMAARALGRARQRESAEPLARHLDDEWMVAANCATALRWLGAEGLGQLQARAADTGYVGDLARQMLWEHLATETGGGSGR